MATSPRFTWERRVASADGPANPTTRHVLLTIATHFDRSGYAYPSMRRLAIETGLSERAVVTHVQIAIGEGFLVCQKSEGRVNVYRLATPPTTERRSTPTAERGSAPTDATGSLTTAAERNSLRTARSAVGTERGSGEVLHDVQSNNVLSTSINKKESIPEERTPSDFSLNPEQTTPPEQLKTSRSIASWAEENGIAQRTGETAYEFRRRCITEWVRLCGSATSSREATP